MIKGTCDNDDCTVAETGMCLEGHPDPSQCPYFHPVKELAPSQSSEEEPQATARPETEEPPLLRRFHSGNELGIEEAFEIMRGRYMHLIGILGAYNVGKTCFLSSLYLMAACGGLQPDYLFAGSLTLQGFEIRARRLRKWKGGGLPAKLADHTYLQDSSTPAFMHLALQEQSNEPRRLELLLTDLPGEWSTDLINRGNTASRFAFLGRADGIIYVIDGPLLASARSRNSQVLAAKLMHQRLLYDVKVDKDIPLVLFISKSDELDMRRPRVIAQITEDAFQLGFRPAVILGASFSRKPAKIPSGTGVLEAIKTIVNYDWPQPLSFESKRVPKGSRAFWRFRLS